ncbi:MAG TPA: hypothetical protein VFB78_08730, partial [Acidimicrobiales bacterium]|nr:hypothetical protein [Acidimicrobiales bacterium]
MRRLLVTLVMLATVAVAFAPAASSAEVVHLIQVDGTLDPIMADFVHDTLKAAKGDVVIQLNSSRGVLSQRRLDALTREIAGARTKVGVWVGPARAGRARGQAVALLEAAPIRGVAPGAKVDIRGITTIHSE